ncbi:acetyl-CoA C-acyltransferase [Achromobacter sp. SIMBA_011]|jgi:acetyl-CoA C-acetyltransferase|uniref:acetyl-CoA C-acyltransferase n=1 Tax=Achromobacter TaxID=222 RepID=UPI0001F43B18|nr:MULTISPECIES: acetyl-CoA C-acyltransferase [Achromobacter]EFV86219.1 beta-Ketoadipyl CoA thiolase [Achromobacter xylosoxidans C54]MCZ8409168.1 acetyl-CoA C-acyltransferase [Achromobacter dolens]
MDCFVYDGIRSPIGRRAGGLSSIRPDDLLGLCIKEAIRRTGVAADQIDDVIAGCTSQSGEDARNVARHASLVAGLPVSIPGQTVNRLCGSGMQAVLSAAHASTAQQGELFIAGGVESMTRAPFVLSKSETAFAREPKMFEALGARFPNPRIIKEFGGDAMPQTADNVARELDVTRSAADQFALASQLKYTQAKQAGFYDDEILPIEIRGRKGAAATVAEDEHPRGETTIEGLQALKTLYADGVVTAGNASGVNDGAVALLVGSRSAGKRLGLRPRARVLAGAVSGIAPRVMGLGPVDASRIALKRAGLSLAQMDVIELNEAFAAQVLGCLKLMDLCGDDKRVNANGGAIAIGHPLGASGARLVLTATRQLEHINGRYALATMCIGLGQGIAVVIERC